MPVFKGGEGMYSDSCDLKGAINVFARQWALSSLIALCAIFVVLSAWLLIHLGFDAHATMGLMLRYITDAELVLIAVVVGAVVGLIEAAVMRFWPRRRLKQTLRAVKTSKRST